MRPFYVLALLWSFAGCSDGGSALESTDEARGASRFLAEDTGDCKCNRFRCQYESLGPFEYATTDFLNAEVQMCLRNNSAAYNLAGDCKHCTNCNNDVCECLDSSECSNWLKIVAVVLASLIALGLCGFACLSIYRNFHTYFCLKTYQQEGNVFLQLDPWERDLRLSVCCPCVCAIILIVGVIVLLTYYYNFTDQPDCSAYTTPGSCASAYCTWDGTTCNDQE